MSIQYMAPGFEPTYLTNIITKPGLRDQNVFPRKKKHKPIEHLWW